MNDLLQKLENLYEKREEIGRLLTDPETLSDQKKYIRLNKEYKNLEPLSNVYRQYETLLNTIIQAKEIIKNEKDEEFKQLAKEELDEALAAQPILEKEIKMMLIPKDPEDSKNAIVELRAGTGGDEAAIFVGDLYRMYTRYVENRPGWKHELVSMSEESAGVYKEIVFEVSGDDVYALLKFESGVHRVQRVPETESQGRVHTSAASVAVLPEAEDVDIELKESDIRKDTFRASGAGGQHVNKTESAIRLTHIPTGTVVECQDERSQIKNHEKALKVLRSRLYEQELNKLQAERASKRKSMVSTGDRSAKIRTYNYPQGRVTDHRINLTLYNLSAIMNGDLHPIIEALQIAENTEKLNENTTD